MRNISNCLIHASGLHVMLILLVTAMSANLSAQESSPGNIQGVWRGQWRSASTGHKGPMRVAITPTNQGTYQARFTGRFAAVIPFAYRAELIPVTAQDGSVQLTSSKKLGPILGSYEMQTRVLGNTLSGEFQAAGDRGTILMQRVGR